MNTYNKVDNSHKGALTPRQANKMSRFPGAFIALNRDSKYIVVLDEGPKPAVTAMAITYNRLTVRDNPTTGSNRVRHGAITHRFPRLHEGKIGTHN